MTETKTIAAFCKVEVDPATKGAQKTSITIKKRLRARLT